MEKNKLSLKLKEFLRKVIIVDSSVVIKAVFVEEGSEFVRELIRADLRGELTLMSTHLLAFEFFNVVSRVLKNESEAKIAFEKFKKMNIGMIDLDDKAFCSAIGSVSGNLKLSFYDAAYHSLAKSMDATFLTADEKYYNLTKREGNIRLFK